MIFVSILVISRHSRFSIYKFIEMLRIKSSSLFEKKSVEKLTKDAMIKNKRLINT